MARTHGLDKRIAEEQDAMTSTQKLPKHHSFASSTQDSAITTPSASPVGPAGRYDSGKNVSPSKANRAPKPVTPAVAQGPASKSKQGGY